MERNADNLISSEGAPLVADILFPCYGGPYDGKYYPDNRVPMGYRKFPVRKRTVYLWKAIKVERLDFNILDRASRMLSADFYTGLQEDLDEETELD